MAKVFLLSTSLACHLGGGSQNQRRLKDWGLSRFGGSKIPIPILIPIPIQGFKLGWKGNLEGS